MSESVYAVYEMIDGDERIVALFPDTGNAVIRALKWGDERYEEMHSAETYKHKTGEAYLKKHHGVHVDSEL